MNFFNRQSRLLRSARLIAMAGTVALVLTACGSGAASDKGKELSTEKVAEAEASVAKAEAGPTTISETVPLSKTPPRDKLVVFIGAATPSDSEHREGVEEASALLGWRTKSITFDAANISTFDTALLQALRLNADYVVNSGIAESQISKSTLAKYKDAGVPIFGTNVYPVTQNEPYVGLAGGGNAFLHGGSVLADWFVADSKGTGKVLEISITSYPILSALGETFDERVKKTCPSCSTVKLSQTFGDFANGSIPTTVVTKLRADRSIKYVMFDNSGEASGLDAKLKAAGLDDIQAIGFAIDSTIAKSIKSGQSRAFVAYNFRYDGWAAVDAAARLSIGDPQTGDEVLSASRMITKSNVDELPADAVYRGPDDALAQFAKLWGVPAS